MFLKDLVQKYSNDQELGEALRYLVTNENYSEFKEYTDFIKTMKVYPEKHAIVYPALGLAGESGEIAEKVKKWLRGDRELDVDALMKELGDPMWYITSFADDLGYTLADVVDINIEKLSSRKERGVLKGNGDNR